MLYEPQEKLNPKQRAEVLRAVGCSLQPCTGNSCDDKLPSWPSFGPHRRRKKGKPAAWASAGLSYNHIKTCAELQYSINQCSETGSGGCHRNAIFGRPLYHGLS